MRLLEIEKQINDYIKTEKLDQRPMYFWETQEIIVRQLHIMLEKYLKEDDTISISSYGSKGNSGNVYIKGYYTECITFKIRRKVIVEKHDLWCNTTKYGIKCVELTPRDKYETIEDYIKENKSRKQVLADQRKNKVDTFVDSLNTRDVSMKDFLELLEIYNKIEWLDKEKLKKEVKK